MRLSVGAMSVTMLRVVRGGDEAWEVWLSEWLAPRVRRKTGTWLARSEHFSVTELTYVNGRV